MSTTDTFTSTSTWTCPAYVTTVWARCWGGGGAGGGVTATPATTSVAGGGGAGGAFAEGLAIPVVPGTVYTVTVAATRTGSTGNGGAGNDSWFLSNTTVIAKGGAGGQAPPNGFGSAGVGGNGSTTGCIGDNKFRGGSGASANGNSTAFLGGGGGGAGSSAAGSDAFTTSPGGGGSANGGSGGTPPAVASAGAAGSVYGGGGSGAFGTVASHSFAGGNGAAGRVELEYTPSYIPAGGGVRAVSTVPVDVASAPAVIDTLTPVGGDVFLLVNNGTDSGLWSWASAGAAMTSVLDADGTYRDVREGTHAGARVFVASGPFVGAPSPFLVVGAPDPVLPASNAYFINPDIPNWVVSPQFGPEGYVGVLPTVGGGGSCVVTHNLGTRFLLVAIAATAAPFAFVKLGGADWVVERTGLDSVTVRPPSAITAGDYELMLRKAA